MVKPTDTASSAISKADPAAINAQAERDAVHQMKAIAAAAGAHLATDAPPAESLEAQRERALTNQGNTVRASWRFSADNVRANIAYMSPLARELLVWAFLWCIDQDHPLRFEDFCEEVGYNPNTVWKMYSGKYKHPTDGSKLDAPEKLLKAIREFRRVQLAKQSRAVKHFVRTPTVARIYWAVDRARKRGRPIMLHGGSHIGKTEALKQNAIENNHGKTILVELEAVNGLKGVLQAIAPKVGVSPKGNTPALIERIKNALTPDMVLILDEVHLLANVYRKGSFFACMEQIRRIWDHVKCGLVMTWTSLGYEKASVERKTELMQVFKRAAWTVNLGEVPTVDDVRAITESFGLPWAERRDPIQVTAKISDTPWEVLRQLCREDGLAAIFERINDAQEHAADDNRSDITWHDFLVAHYSHLKQAQAPDSGWGEGRAA